MIDKKQLMGGAVIAIALLGVSVATGKLNIDKLTGKASDGTPAFERRLPPKVEDTSAAPAVEVPAIETTTADVTAAGGEDVLASLAGESPPPTDAFVNDLVAAAGDAGVTSDVSPGEGPLPSEGPKLASTDPSQIVVNGTTFTATPVIAAGVATPTALEKGPELPKVQSPLVAAPANAQAQAIKPSSGPLPPPGGELSVPGNNAPTSAPSESASSFTASSSGSSPKVPVSAEVDAAGGAFNAGAIAALPATATGTDLLALQTQLAVLEKQQKIAAGQEAIAESRLKTAKAHYEMSQIGRPSAEQVAAAKAAAAQKAAVAVAPAPAPSPLHSVKLLSTTRANGSIGGTISFNGKLVDVKKGSVVQGFMVEKLTDNSLTLAGDGESKTVWID